MKHIIIQEKSLFQDQLAHMMPGGDYMLYHSQRARKDDRITALDNLEYVPKNNLWVLSTGGDEMRRTA
jgi:hypothetical protein